MVLDKPLLVEKTQVEALYQAAQSGSFQKGHYKDVGAKLDITSERRGHYVIGRHSVVEQYSIIEDSTIGHKCKIGKNVSIINSIIWHSCIIEDDVVI